MIAVNQNDKAQEQIHIPSLLSKECISGHTVEAVNVFNELYMAQKEKSTINI